MRIKGPTTTKRQHPEHDVETPKVVHDSNTPWTMMPQKTFLFGTFRENTHTHTYTKPTSNNNNRTKGLNLIIRLGPAHNVHFTQQRHTANDHGEDNHWQVHAREFNVADVDVFLGQDVAPQEAGQRAREGQGEGAVVDAQGHAVHGGPKGAVADGDAVLAVDFLPGLDDAREEDGGADVGTGELVTMMLAGEEVGRPWFHEKASGMI